MCYYFFVAGDVPPSRRQPHFLKIELPLFVRQYRVSRPQGERPILFLRVGRFLFVQVRCDHI